MIQRIIEKNKNGEVEEISKSILREGESYKGIVIEENQKRER